MKQGRKTAAIENDGAEDYGKYNAARAKREAANAELAELVLKEKEGDQPRTLSSSARRCPPHLPLVPPPGPAFD